MTKTTEFLPVTVDSCYAPPLKRTLDRLNHNTVVHEESIQNINLAGPITYVTSNPVTYYVNPGEDSGGAIAFRRAPEVLIELTSTVNNTTSIATAKLLEWNGSAYVVTGNNFNVYDVFKKWRHALSGDRGFLGYDEERAVLVMKDMDSPFVRRVTLDSDLGSGDGTSVSADDADTSQAISAVYGTFVKSGSSIPATSNEVVAKWFSKANSGAGAWRAILSRECLV